MDINKKFVKNNDILFTAEDHVYKSKSNPEIDFTSVTQFVKKFFSEFDSQKISKKLVSSHPVYQHMTQEELLAKWEKSSEMGRIIHKEIEDYINTGKEGIEEKSKKAINYLKKNINQKLELYPEVIVHSKKLKIAGTIDLIIYNKENDEYNLVDWKTNKAIKRKAFKNKKGIKKSTRELDDCQYIHYSLQLSLYKFLLEEDGFKNINKISIMHLKDNEILYISCKYMKKEIQNMLKEKKLI